MKTPTRHGVSTADPPQKSDTEVVETELVHDGNHTGSQRYTRSVVASTLNVSVTTVRRFEGTLLHPVKGTDGIHLFDPAEVQELANRRPTPSPAKNSTSEGEVAAAAFALFKKKTSPRDVVIELEQSPTVIQKLYEDWERLGDRVVLGEEILGILDRMVAARLIDEEVVSAIWNNSADRLRSFVETRAKERQTPRRRR
jgi:hypothetical protein